MGDYDRDPQPHKTTSGYHVHWAGYFLDPAPTETLRASGEMVRVYAYDEDDVHLPPTALPGIPEPWAFRFLQYGGCHGAKMCGGAEGGRFITNGHWQARVPEDVFAACAAAGWKNVGDHWYEPATLGETVALSGDMPTRHLSNWGRSTYPAVCVGGIWIREEYRDLMLACGATNAAPVNDEYGRRVVAPDLIIVMGIHVDSEEQS